MCSAQGLALFREASLMKKPSDMAVMAQILVKISLHLAPGNALDALALIAYDVFAVFSLQCIFCQIIPSCSL